MRTLGFALLALAMTSTAYAQDASMPGNQPTSGNSSNEAVTQAQSQQRQPRTGAQIAGEIRSSLENAGFRNIKMVPRSFFIRAEDRDGNPVTMLLNPDSITSVTQLTEPNRGTVGRSPNMGASDDRDMGGPDTQ